MDEIKTAIIFNKETVEVNKKLLNVYKVEDYCLGLYYKVAFFPVTGKYIGKIILTNHNNAKLSAFPILLLKDLLRDDEINYDFSKYLNQVSNVFCNKYYIEEGHNKFTKLTNKAIIKELNKKNKKDIKDFNEKNTNTESDISRLYKEIKKTIISQDEQIMMILTSLFKNNRVIKSNLSEEVVHKLKENILILGPTGTGKTEILTRISKNYDLPIVIVNSTSLSETGYQGRNIEDLLRDLYLSANKNLDIAQKGILVIDEFDKLSEKNTHETVSRIGVQRSLLKLLDGSKMYFDDMVFDTSKLTIVGLSAFSGIKSKDDYKNITTEDLVKYGLMQELVDKFSNVIKMNSLTKEDLKKILLESDLSPINIYKKLFSEMNVNFSYDSDFINYIAEKAEQLDTGAKGLKTIFDEQIRDVLFNIFSGDYMDVSLSKPNENGISYTLNSRKNKKLFFNKNK